MKKNELVISFDTGDAEHSLYEAYVSGDKTIKLERSPLDQGWDPSCLETPILSIKERDEDVKIKFTESKKGIKLDFSEITELYIALSYYFHNSGFDDWHYKINKFIKVDE